MHKWITGIIAVCFAALAISGCGDTSTAPAAANSTASASVAVKNAALPIGTINTIYSTFLGVSGGKAPYKWSVVTGKLPAGLFLVEDGSDAGNIIGSPTALGSYDVVFKVTDSSNPPLENQKSLKINVSNLVFSSGTDGGALYSDHCAYCHGALGSATQQHKDATVDQIKAAIAADVAGSGTGMGEFAATGLFPLSDAQLALIVASITSPPVVGPTAPSAPTGVSAASGQLLNTISWSAAAGATTYNLYWSLTSGVTTATGTKVSAVSSPYTHSSLTPGTPYYYIVTAQNATGESNASAQVTATPSATPVAPDGVALYNSKCLGCHPALASFNHKGASAATIQNAINTNYMGMGTTALRALTSAEVAAIAVAVQ